MLLYLHIWFVELFDHKVVPNVPGDASVPGNSYRRILSNGPIDKSAFNPFSASLVSDHSQPLENSLRKSYNSLLNLNVDPTPSWYRDINNWIWLGTLALKGAAIAGVLYFGYKFIIDPLFINDLGDIKGTAKAGVDLNPDTVDEGIASKKGSGVWIFFSNSSESSLLR